jgi:uncharacterized membrane protein
MQFHNQFLKTNSALRSSALDQLRGNWGIAILLCLIFSIICGLPAYIPYLGLIIGIALSGPLTLGLATCFLKLVRHESFIIDNLFDGFKKFSSAVITQLLITIFIFLWSLPFIIPGIIASYSYSIVFYILSHWTLLFLIPGIIASYRYSMVFYILSDNPEMSSMESLKKSSKMMMGFKWKLFCLHLSFIGWALLSILTLGIAYLWLTPYVYSSIAHFYEDLKIAQVNKPLY